jgi:curved DNA-binding protein CbpA
MTWQAKLPGPDLGAEDAFKQVNKAWDVLGDKNNRATYDNRRLAAAAAAVESALAGNNKEAFKDSEVELAKQQVLRFLNYKPRTRSELLRKLIEDKLYPAGVAHAAMDYLQEKQVHSDVDYAEQWARYKWRTGKWAPWQGPATRSTGLTLVHFSAQRKRFVLDTGCI